MVKIEKRGTGFIQYVEDIELTEAQQNLKWHIYAECEWKLNSDVAAVLKSLLKDFTEVKK